MRIYPQSLSGEVKIQPSKSHLHRLLILSALHGGGTVKNVNKSDDVLATINALEQMGLAKTSLSGNEAIVTKGGGAVKGVVDCGESGSTLRFLSAIALLLGEEVAFKGKGRLMERPMRALEEFCKKYGFEYKKSSDTLLVKGALSPGEYVISGEDSSQFVSGLLMALSVFEEPSVITVDGRMPSKAYIDITIDAFKEFGVDAKRNGNVITVCGGKAAKRTVTAKGDWSHAAVFACMGAKEGGISLLGLDINSLQGDKTVLELLQKMGTDIKIEGDIIRINGGLNRGIGFDGDEIPDIVPPLCVLLGVCKGKHTVTDIGRLRLKESDRIEAVCSLINSLGGKAESNGDSIIIEGVNGYKGGKVNTFADHRIAMAAAVASCYSSGIIEISAEDCVKKSAPDFWSEFTALGGKIER